MNFELSEKAKVKIEKLNEKCCIMQGYHSNAILDLVNQLQLYGSVNIGYRLSTGKIDLTLKKFELWKKVVKILEKENIFLIKESVFSANKSPTMANGFWDEYKYTLITKL